MPDCPVLQVLLYQTSDRKRPFEDWMAQLRADRSARAAIQVRIDRIERGLLGDWKSVGGGVGELRVDFGPGYRIYFGRDDQTAVILLCGGTKGTQTRDIGIARRFWRDYEKRKGSAGSSS